MLAVINLIVNIITLCVLAGILYAAFRREQ